MHEEKANKHANEDTVPKGAVPAYLLDREGVSRAKVCILLVAKVCRRLQTGGLTVVAVFACLSALGVEQHCEAKAKGEGWQMVSAYPQGEPCDR